LIEASWTNIPRSSGRNGAADQFRRQAANQTLWDAALLQDRLKDAPQEITSHNRLCRFFEKVE
jgi:hypothetical protein